MTERTPWWKAFLPKWKSSGSKDASASNTIGPDFDPFATCRNTGDQPKDSNNSSNLLSNERYDDSQIDSFFNERSTRRNMTVSRSGRFKEKRKVRSSLPIQEKEKVASGQKD